MTIIEYIRAQDTESLQKIIAEYRTTQETGTIACDSVLRTIAEECGYPEHTFTMMAFVIYTNALSECYDRFQASTDIETLSAIEEIRKRSVGTIIGQNAMRLMSSKASLMTEMENLCLKLEDTEAQLAALGKDALAVSEFVRNKIPYHVPLDVCGKDVYEAAIRIFKATKEK